MTRTTTQRELRNDSREIMRALDRGEEFIVTRNGITVGELRPVRRRFVDRTVLLEASRPLSFDDQAARAFGRIYAATRASARTPRSARVDLLIAAVALANDFPLFTRNPADFGHRTNIGVQAHPV